MTVWPEVSARRAFRVGAIEVVTAGLDAPPAALRGLSEWLCDAEQRRAARFHFDRDRRRFVVARARRRELLGERLGMRPQALELVPDSNGKPALAPRLAASGWRFNMSHCDELALYAFSRGPRGRHRPRGDPAARRGRRHRRALLRVRREPRLQRLYSK